MPWKDTFAVGEQFTRLGVIGDLIRATDEVGHLYDEAEGLYVPYSERTNAQLVGDRFPRSDFFIHWRFLINVIDPAKIPTQIPLPESPYPTNSIAWHAYWATNLRFTESEAAAAVGVDTDYQHRRLRPKEFTLALPNKILSGAVLNGSSNGGFDINAQNGDVARCVDDGKVYQRTAGVWVLVTDPSVRPQNWTPDGDHLYPGDYYLVEHFNMKAKVLKKIEVTSGSFATTIDRVVKTGFAEVVGDEQAAWAQAKADAGVNDSGFIQQFATAGTAGQQVSQWGFAARRDTAEITLATAVEGAGSAVLSRRVNLYLGARLPSLGFGIAQFDAQGTGLVVDVARRVHIETSSDRRVEYVIEADGGSWVDLLPPSVKCKGFVLADELYVGGVNLVIYEWNVPGGKRYT
jgi:hypothetical protein